MKIIVSASGQTLGAQIDPRFGRAAFFIAVDTDTNTFVAHDNVQNLNAAQGAGIQSAETVSRIGGEVVITGHCGPKAFKTLSAAGIKVVVGAQGTVADAIAAFKSGALVPTDAANVEGHWV
ncbi:MAG TPA: NifB/NifX family molybdenum-iron cluster-binding protein [Candidatus Hydrogenedentes bacterium]|nr:NifB/NifX family molybdenum-iron cluster-binding protein [Candidatus Hydrogenedentota bacterium]